MQLKTLDVQITGPSTDPIAPTTTSDPTTTSGATTTDLVDQNHQAIGVSIGVVVIVATCVLIPMLLILWKCNRHSKGEPTTKSVTVQDDLDPQRCPKLPSGSIEPIFEPQDIGDKTNCIIDTSQTTASKEEGSQETTELVLHKVKPTRRTERHSNTDRTCSEGRLLIMFMSSLPHKRHNHIWL